MPSVRDFLDNNTNNCKDYSPTDDRNDNDDCDDLVRCLIRIKIMADEEDKELNKYKHKYQKLEKVVPTRTVPEGKLASHPTYIRTFKQIYDILIKKPYLLMYIPMKFHTSEMINIVLGGNINMGRRLISQVNPILLKRSHMEFAFSRNDSAFFLVYDYSFLNDIHESILVKYKDIICEKIYKNLPEISHIDSRRFRGSKGAKSIYNEILHRCAERLHYLGKYSGDLVVSYLDY